MQVAQYEEDAQDHTPAESLVLAYAAMLPIASGTAASLALGRERGAALEVSTIRFAGAVLCFLAGVRRGLSFRQPGGPTVGQLGVMFSAFSLGSGALLLPPRKPALLLLLSGFGLLALLDPEAARTHQAPRFFARLRPVQMVIPIASLAALFFRRSKSVK